jgi:hypothetical protein
MANVKSRYPAENYRGYTIRPGAIVPEYNDYQVFILKGENRTDTVNHISWRASIEKARSIIDQKPDALPKPVGYGQPVVVDSIVENRQKVVEVLRQATVSAPIRHDKPVLPVRVLSPSEINNVPELKLTEMIYNEVYKPEGWHLLIIGPTATWRQEWKEWEAIRDIVQNALDESEEYTFGYDGAGLWIADRGRGISISDFLLGPAKLKPDYARGKFGEGMKISALVLTRLGYRVHVRTSDKDLWICYYAQEVGSGNRAMTLAALWKESNANSGTKFNILGYTGDSFSQKFAVNEPKLNLVQSSPSYLKGPLHRFNQIYRATSDFPSVLYCRDIYLQNIVSDFSYNLWGFDLSPDRHGPKSESDVSVDVGRTWACVDNVQMLKYLFKCLLSRSVLGKPTPYEKESVNMGSWTLGVPAYHDGYPHEISYSEIMDLNKESWQTAWKAIAGSKAVIRTESKYDNMVTHLGYTSFSLPYGVSSELQTILGSDFTVIRENLDNLRRASIVDDKELTPKLLASLDLAREISRGSLYSAYPVFAAIIPNDPKSGMVTDGLFDPITKEIYISLNVLETGLRTVDVTIHELSHAFSNGSVDLSQPFEDALSEVSSRVFRLVAQGKFDTQLKNPYFQWE